MTTPLDHLHVSPIDTLILSRLFEVNGAVAVVNTLASLAEARSTGLDNHGFDALALRSASRMMLDGHQHADRCNHVGFKYVQRHD